MAIVTGLSGNELYCLDQKGYAPGNIVVGNSVFSLGFLGSLGSGIKTFIGGEVTQVTNVIHEGRLESFQRLQNEAKKHGSRGITGVSSTIVQHGPNIEFLSIGSALHTKGVESAENYKFSTSADGQELYCQLDCGFQPISFAFGNVAYALGLGGGLFGMLRSLGRGEITEFSQVFNNTRHLALQRIVEDARGVGANAVVGIKTSILPFQGGVVEMLMIGTASYHENLPALHTKSPITSDLTNEEMWNVIAMGYMPLRLCMGVSVYSLGFIGGFTSMIKSFVRGEISELTSLIYDARENAFDKLKQEADKAGADDILGVQTYVYDLGNGIIEFMAIGTAVKKMPDIAKTHSPQIIPQAVIQDKSTFVNLSEFSVGGDLNSPTR